MRLSYIESRRVELTKGEPMKWASFPTWCFTRFILLFVSNVHPWAGRRFTLGDWHAQQTPFCKQFDRALWIAALGVVLLLMFVYPGNL